jgi:hypothetical protein
VQLNKKKRKEKRKTYGEMTICDMYIVVSVIVGLICCHAPLLSCHPPCRSIAVDAHNPPYEQVLVGMGWVSSPSVVVLSPLPCIPSSSCWCWCWQCVTSPPCHHRQAAPAIPPYEQLLKGMGVGAVSSAVVWCGAWMALVVSTCDPPHEQLLVGMGWMFVRCCCRALGKEVGASSA